MQSTLKVRHLSTKYVGFIYESGKWYLWRDLGIFVDIQMNISSTTVSEVLVLLWNGHWWDNWMRGCKILHLGTQTATQLSKLLHIKYPYRPHTYDDWLCQFWREKMYKILWMKEESGYLNLQMRLICHVRGCKLYKGTLAWECHRAVGGLLTLETGNQD